MIIEVRTYTLKPGSLAEVEKRFADALPNRLKHSKLAAFWHSEVGKLNQIIHVWPYDSFEHRAAVRAAAAKEPGWPPPNSEFITDMQNEVFTRRRSRRRWSHAQLVRCSRSASTR